MNNIRIVRQHDSRDCGAACLCMISNYYGIKCSIQQARKITETGQDGVSIWGLIEGAKRIGLAGNSYKGNTADLKKYLSDNPSPVILHMKINHFVVVKKISKNFLIVYDPAYGKRKYNWKMIDSEWSGYIISFSKNENIVYQKQKNMSGQRILKLIRQNTKQLVFIAFLSILISGITFCSAYIFQLLIDYGGALNELSEHGSSNWIVHGLLTLSNNNLLQLLIVMLGMFIIMGVIYAIRGCIISSMSRKLDTTLITQYVSQIFKSTLHDLSSKMTGEYLARISDLTSVRRLISELLVSFCYDIFMILVSIFILYNTNNILWGLSFIIIIIYAIQLIIFNGLFKRVNYKIMASNAEMQSFFKESIQGIEVIKANNIDKKIKLNILKKYGALTNNIYRGNLLNVLSGSISLILEQASNTIIVFAGFWLVNKEIFSLGELITFYMILSCLTTPVKDILAMLPIFQSALIALDRVEDIYYFEEETQIKDSKTLNVPIHSIEFKDVSFHYFGKEDLFSDFSMKISGSRKIGITGINGSGKSTLIKLLLAFEKPNRGSIEFNQHAIETLNISDIRSKVSYVVQNNFLFADTIYNNITLSEENISMELVLACSKITGLLDFIDTFPLGFETYVNENGDNLSVGQKQAIALTRSLVRKPQLLILDEATSNMDYHREKYAISNILSLPIPCIIITHNQEILKKVDEVIVL